MPSWIFVTAWLSQHPRYFFFSKFCQFSFTSEPHEIIFTCTKLCHFFPISNGPLLPVLLTKPSSLWPNFLRRNFKLHVSDTCQYSLFRLVSSSLHYTAPWLLKLPSTLQYTGRQWSLVTHAPDFTQNSTLVIQLLLKDFQPIIFSSHNGVCQVIKIGAKSKISNFPL